MHYFIIGLGLFIGLFFVTRGLLRSKPKQFVVTVRRIVGLGLLAYGIFFVVTGRWPIGAFLILFALPFGIGGELTLEGIDPKYFRTGAPNDRLESMTAEEALAILGLEKGAKADAIKAAHRKLVSRLHPDHGGSDYLASKLNRARDILMKELDYGAAARRGGSLEGDDDSDDGGAVNM